MHRISAEITKGLLGPRKGESENKNEGPRDTISKYAADLGSITGTFYSPLTLPGVSLEYCQ